MREEREFAEPVLDVSCAVKGGVDHRVRGWDAGEGVATLPPPFQRRVAGPITVPFRGRPCEWPTSELDHRIRSTSY